MSKFKDLQSVLIFMLESPLHKTWTVEEICRCILLPILLDQYKIIYEKDYFNQFNIIHCYGATIIGQVSLNTLFLVNKFYEYQVGESKYKYLCRGWR